jgi:hypothetical protein
MLLPQYRLRQQRLQRALANYPIYDPPHKAEERILQRDQALENFEYFLDVRQERVRYFLSWLHSKFGLDARLEEHGLDSVLGWALEYTAVLMPPLETRKGGEVFLEYSQPWTGAYTGANTLFDLGATLGEAIILRRPQLKWQMEWSLSDFPDYRNVMSKEEQLILLSTERDVRLAKREARSGFRRPLLASMSNALDYEPVFDITLSYYLLMTQSVTVEYAWRTLNKPKGLRSRHPDYLRHYLIAAMSR